MSEMSKTSTPDGFEVYKLAFQHTDKEWEMLWQRNGHFLVGNSALLVALGLLSSAVYFGLIISILGLLLAIIWWHSNREAYAFNFYWIRELRRLEEHLSGCDLWTRVASQTARVQGRPSTRYNHHGTYLAIVFALIWALIVLYFVLIILGMLPPVAIPQSVP
jgi:hypothetical protein